MLAIWYPASELVAALKRTTGSAPRLSAIAHDKDGRPVALAIGAARRVGAWPLSDAVRAAVDAEPRRFAILGVRAASEYVLPEILTAWQLTRSEARLAGALVRSGDLRDAARDAGIGYERARELVASVMVKTGARRQPELVRDLALLVYGELPLHALAARILVLPEGGRFMHMSHAPEMGAALVD